MKLNDIPPDSEGGASAPDESPTSTDSSSAALAPAALNSTPVVRWSAEEVTLYFGNLVRTLAHTRETIERELAALAPRCPNADTFIAGCHALGREAADLNSHLINVQVAIRLGAKLS